MIGRAALSLLVVLAAPLSVSAGEQPYAGLEAREIKALSAEEIAALEGGLGFSQALAAELNSYPGPRHVLDLAEDLALTPQQKSAVEALFREMQAEAAAAGRAVLVREAALETAFRNAEASEAGIVAIATEIGTLRGVLRGIHLKYHVRTKALLTAHQVALYDRARGYADGVAPGGHGSHGHHHGG
jgi:hypothetical protein